MVGLIQQQTDLQGSGYTTVPSAIVARQSLGIVVVESIIIVD